MIDHVGLPVGDLARSLAFYEAALAPLGYERLTEGGPGAAEVAFGREKPELWLRRTEGRPASLHVAVTADTPAAVDAFRAAALAAGGSNGGAPEHGTEPGDYAVVILDPDGHRIESVCQGGTALDIGELSAQNDV